MSPCACVFFQKEPAQAGPQIPLESPPVQRLKKPILSGPVGIWLRGIWVLQSPAGTPLLSEWAFQGLPDLQVAASEPKS